MRAPDVRGEATTTVVVTVWRHGDDVVGRVTPVEHAGWPASRGTPCGSIDDICDAVRDLVEMAVTGA